MKVLNMNYLEHYKKNFDELLKLSDNEDFRKKNFDFFSQNGFPVKKKSDERWKYIDLRSLEKTLYISDLKNSVKGPNLNDIGLQDSNTIKVVNGIAEIGEINGIDYISSKSYEPVISLNEDEFISLNFSKTILLK